MMKRLSLVALLLALSSVVLLVAQQSPSFLSRFRNARFVYVTSYSGSQFSVNPLPEDREAIGKVQNALEKWGHYTIVYRPQQADMIVAVETRPSEDILAVYDRHSWREGNYLWRATAKGGLNGSDMPLVQQLEAALNKANGKPA